MMRKKYSAEKILGEKILAKNFSAEKNLKIPLKKFWKKSAGRIREYECFVIHIHNFKTPLLAQLRFTSLGPSACFLSIPRRFPKEDCFVLRVPV